MQVHSKVFITSSLGIGWPLLTGWQSAFSVVNVTFTDLDELIFYQFLDLTKIWKKVLFVQGAGKILPENEFFNLVYNMKIPNKNLNEL